MTIGVILAVVRVSPRNIQARMAIWTSIVFCKTEISKASSFLREWFQRKKAMAVLIRPSQMMIIQLDREMRGRPSRDRDAVARRRVPMTMGEAVRLNVLT